MVFRLYFSVLLSCLSIFSSAQIVAVGKVVDAETGNPIENASVYFNETQIGTKTNIGGRFHISTGNIKGELVISCVGYHKVVLKEIPQQNLKILLKPIDNTLKEVVIGNNLGWEKWGRLFTKLLMSDNAHDYQSPKYKDQVVLNPKSINFYFDRETNVLAASSLEPIWVINDPLGYLIKVDLEEFKYNIRTEQLSYKSTLFFEPTKSNYSLENVQLTTNSFYQGSTTHFFRALVAGRLNAEGFSIYRYSEVKNISKVQAMARINELKNHRLKNSSSFSINVNLEDLFKGKDSLTYYRRMLMQPNYLSRKLDTLNVEDILKYDKIQNVFELNFKDTIMVTYIRNQKLLSQHTNFINIRRDRKEFIKVETILCLTDGQPMIITASGLPLSFNLYMSGFMSGKRLASFLPTDFDPQVPRFKVTDDALKNHVIFRDESP